MIKVLEEKEVPRAQVKCDNCGSVLEYGNADLSIDYKRENQFPMTSAEYTIHCYQITCPVCGCSQPAGWIK